MVEVKATIDTYTKNNDEGEEVNGLTVYITAVQKVEDGERLGGDGDRSSLFKKVGKKTRADVADDDDDADEKPKSGGRRSL